MLIQSTGSDFHPAHGCCAAFSLDFTFFRVLLCSSKTAFLPQSHCTHAPRVRGVFPQWEICDSGRCDAGLFFQPVSSCSEATALTRLTPFPSPTPSQTLMVDGVLSPTEGWICCLSRTLRVKTRDKNLFSISGLSSLSGYPSYFPIYSIVSQQ